MLQLLFCSLKKSLLNVRSVLSLPKEMEDREVLIQGLAVVFASTTCGKERLRKIGDIEVFRNFIGGLLFESFSTRVRAKQELTVFKDKGEKLIRYCLEHFGYDNTNYTKSVSSLLTSCYLSTSPAILPLKKHDIDDEPCSIPAEVRDAAMV